MDLTLQWTYTVKYVLYAHMYYKPTPLFTPKFLHGYYSTCSIRPPQVFYAGTLCGKYMHNFCPATCFRRRPILARRRPDSIQVEVPNLFIVWRSSANSQAMPD